MVLHGSSSYLVVILCYRLAVPWIRINTPKMRHFGGNLIQISFSGPTTSRRPVDRPLISPNTLTAASNPSYTRLEAILGASQAKTTRPRPFHSKLIINLARRVGIRS